MGDLDAYRRESTPAEAGLDETALVTATAGDPGGAQAGLSAPMISVTCGSGSAGVCGPSSPPPAVGP
ncbi:hypothetical protein ABZT06_25770 [Streptomyces sp. NPDC005483]|uniref:hypothetical protein n=1 Tax=Streptomyces sp. NPDC005483 TaxID=3154882 RepID=UPI0033ADA8EA